MCGVLNWDACLLCLIGFRKDCEFKRARRGVNCVLKIATLHLTVVGNLNVILSITCGMVTAVDMGKS